MLTPAVLAAALDGSGDERVLTLDPAFQGLPDTAHGGSVLAAFDLAAGAAGGRRLDGHYLRRVPLATPLQLGMRRAADGDRLELREDDTVLVRGTVTPTAAPAHDAGTVAPPAGDAPALPISRTCFACGIDNPLGLGLRLRADEDAVGGTWSPPPRFAGGGGALAPVALTTLLDEAAFWLGALATGEAGMTTELRIVLHAEAAADAAVIVAGARAAVRPRADDPRYQETTLTARDPGGRLIASAVITFVAVRGAARRLVTGMLALNPPALLHRVFPGYAPPA
jgi:acyl-coenzyme A thioesterase PaaI-like protein